MPRRKQRGGFGSAASERHLQIVGFAVVLQDVLFQVIEEYDGFHFIWTDTAAGGIADCKGRSGRAGWPNGSTGDAGGSNLEQMTPGQFRISGNLQNRH